MSLVKQEEPTGSSKAVAIKNGPQVRPRKVIEEDEYLGRMARIIKRDFFLNPCANDTLNTPATTTYTDSERSHQTNYTETPGTGRTDLTSSSSVRSRRADKSMHLNEFLEKHTSEDNAYFDKLQRRDLRRHRAKFPWLYTDRNNHNKQVHQQLQLGSTANKSIQNSEQSQAKMIDWHYNPKNALFYPPSDAKAQSSSSTSTVNYESNKYGYEPAFKEPLPVRPSEHLRGLDRFADKIGIDGKLLNGSETPTIGGYSFIPPPETPRIDDTPKSKRPTNRYFIPSESPRDDLAYRLYEDKVAKKIRTPKSSTRSDSKKTPKSTLQRMF